jgi:hypothetical protein
MNLRRRQKRKKDQALDAVASVSKLWSELQLGKKASQGVAKAKELRPPSKVKRVLSLKWVRIGGAAAVAGGTAGAVARKLKGDKPESYTGPAPSVAAEAAGPAPDIAPPLAVAPDPATQERDTEPAAGPSALRHNRDAVAAQAASEDGDAPELGDAATRAADDAAQESPAPESDAPEAASGASDAATGAPESASDASDASEEPDDAPPSEVVPKTASTDDE